MTTKNSKTLKKEELTKKSAKKTPLQKTKTITKTVLKKVAVAKTSKAAPKEATVAKTKTSKAAPKQTTVAKTKETVNKTNSINKDKITPKKINASSYEELVSESKFFIGSASQPCFNESNFELPHNYPRNQIITLVRDPYWMYVCWDITQEKIEEISKSMGNAAFKNAKIVLRVLDVTRASADKPNSYFDIEIPGSNNWYVNIPNPDASYCVDIGYKTDNQKFFLISRSNIITSPRSASSTIYEQTTTEKTTTGKTKKEMSSSDYDKIYALSGGLKVGLSSAMLSKEMSEKLQQELSSGLSSAALSSGALSSFSLSSAALSSESVSKQKALAKKRDFFLIVNTELILYGVTVPSAKLTIQGKPKQLNPDGTFSARFALPDGKQVIPVNSKSYDEIDSITITPIVEKETK